jgi:hypothetical protein
MTWLIQNYGTDVFKRHVGIGDADGRVMQIGEILCSIKCVVLILRRTFSTLQYFALPLAYSALDDLNTRTRPGDNIFMADLSNSGEMIEVGAKATKCGLALTCGRASRSRG